MKTTRFWTIVLGFAALVTVAACKKDPDTVDPPATIPDTGVSFTCRDTIGIPDVYVGIAPLATDRDNGIFLKSGTTNFGGIVKFTGLDPQTLYYSASRTTNNGVVRRVGSVEIVKDLVKGVVVQF